MKIKTIVRPLKIDERWNSDVSEDVLLVILPDLDLGNNFSTHNLFDAMSDSMNSDQMDLIRNSSFSEIKLSAKTNYGRLMQTMCEFDFYCFFNDVYKMKLIDEGY